jgi:hypothetical protein
MRRLQSFLGCVVCVAFLGCGGASESAPADEPVEETSGDEGLPLDESAAEREQLTPEECSARGGTIIGDPGDGSTHRPDFVCPSGAPPIGDVAAGSGAAGIEGAACCPE